MKTTNLTVSLLSLSLMLPGFTVLLSRTANAQDNQVNQDNQVCSNQFGDYVVYYMRPRQELRQIAQKAQKVDPAADWRNIGNPITGQLFETDNEARNLGVNDPVCIPAKWVRTPRRPRE